MECADGLSLGRKLYLARQEVQSAYHGSLNGSQGNGGISMGKQLTKLFTSGKRWTAPLWSSFLVHNCNYLVCFFLQWSSIIHCNWYFRIGLNRWQRNLSEWHKSVQRKCTRNFFYLFSLYKFAVWIKNDRFNSKVTQLFLTIVFVFFLNHSFVRKVHLSFFQQLILFSSTSSLLYDSFLSRFKISSYVPF